MPHPEVPTSYDLVDCLNQVFAQIWKLEYHAYSVHWNITGCFFFPIHQFTQEIYESLEDFKDEVAERIRQLGGRPLPSLSAVIAWAGAGEMSPHPDKNVVLTFLASDLQLALEVCQKCGEICDGQKDFQSLDLITRLMNEIGKYKWMAEAQVNQEQLQKVMAEMQSK